MRRSTKFAVSLLGGAALIVGGYETGIMAVAWLGLAVFVLGLWWAKFSRTSR